ncbi:hypothetical protein NORO109296_26645 [Nocardiopsis rhodophaea]
MDVVSPLRGVDHEGQNQPVGVVNELVVPTGAVLPDVRLDRVPQHGAVHRLCANHAPIVDADEHNAVAAQVLLRDIGHTVGHAQDRPAHHHSGPLPVLPLRERQGTLEL